MNSIPTSRTAAPPAELAHLGLARMTDADLARAARSEPAAFAELYKRHFPHVYGYQFLRTGNVQDAQDLTSQTFIAALEGIRRYSGQGSFAAWLMSIAHNKMAMFYRARRPETGLTDAIELPAVGLLLEDQVDQRRLLREIAQALRGLKSERAEVFALRTFGGLSAAETAEVVGKSEAAVKMLVYRALQDLRAALNISIEVEEK